MKLILKRNQADKKKSMFGKKTEVHFILNAQVQLSNTEIELIDKYDIRDAVLFTEDVLFRWSREPTTISITVNNLINGRTFDCVQIGDILTYEANVEKACGALKSNIDVMASFGGEEVLEIE